MSSMLIINSSMHLFCNAKRIGTHYVSMTNDSVPQMLRKENTFT